MKTETVFRYRKYDIASDEYVMSKRFATIHRIHELGADPIMGTQMEIDPKFLDQDGWTAKDFVPPGDQRPKA